MSAAKFLVLGLIGSNVFISSAQALTLEELWQQQQRDDQVRHVSRLDPNCMRIGLRAEKIQQVLAEEILAAELIPTTQQTSQIPRPLFLEARVDCLTQYQGRSAFYSLSVAWKANTDQTHWSQITVGNPLIQLGIGDEAETVLQRLRQGARQKLQEWLEAQDRASR